jgi:hypothetical protein
MPLLNKKKIANTRGTMGMCVVQFDCDANYVSGVGGGYSLDFAPFGCKIPHFVTFQNTQGYEAQYDRVAKAVHFWATATTEAANGDPGVAALVGVRAIAFYER